MADQQYDVSPEFRRLFEEKNRLRRLAKEKFEKIFTSPYYVEKGPLFDVGIHRYHAMQAYQSDYFRHNPRNFGFVTIFYIIPVISLLIFENNVRNKKEHQYRTGQVAYKDRLHA